MPTHHPVEVIEQNRKADRSARSKLVFKGILSFGIHLKLHSVLNIFY